MSLLSFSFLRFCFFPRSSLLQTLRIFHFTTLPPSLSLYKIITIKAAVTTNTNSIGSDGARSGNDGEDEEEEEDDDGLAFGRMEGPSAGRGVFFFTFRL